MCSCAIWCWPTRCLEGDSRDAGKEGRHCLVLLRGACMAGWAVCCYGEGLVMAMSERMIEGAIEILEAYDDDSASISLGRLNEKIPLDCILEDSYLSLHGRATLDLHWVRPETAAEAIVRQANDAERLRRQAARKVITDPITAASIEHREREQLRALIKKYGVI